MNLTTATDLGARLTRSAATIKLGHPDPKFAAVQRDTLRLAGLVAALATAELKGADAGKLATAKAMAVAESRRIGAEVEEIKAWNRHRSGS